MFVNYVQALVIIESPVLHIWWAMLGHVGNSGLHDPRETGQDWWWSFWCGDRAWLCGCNHVLREWVETPGLDRTKFMMQFLACLAMMMGGVEACRLNGLDPV